MSTGTPPVIPDEFQQYNSYVEDPKWQRKFSIVWASAVAAFIVFSLPHLLRSIKNGRAYEDLAGVREYWPWKRANKTDIQQHGTLPSSPRRGKLSTKVEGLLSVLGSVTLWCIPGLGLNLGQIFVVIVYIIVVVLCITQNANLVENSNRAGFLAIAQLPVVFLFATKNSILSLLLGPGNGYEKLNFVHRWSGRSLFICALIHGSLWIKNHLVWDLPILGQQKETSGVACLGLLGVIVLTSVLPVRKWGYQFFFIVHILAYVAFFVTVCYHTIYAPPWIFPPLAFYGFDLCLRMFRYRIKDATIEVVDNQMTLIRVPHCEAGWLAGQHVRLRVFFSGRVMESHPFTILSASSETTCVGEGEGMVFGVSTKGDWTRALNELGKELAVEEAGLRSLINEKQVSAGAQGATTYLPAIQVMIDGPYGGSSVDLGRYTNVLLFAGGSGATFTIGMLDDLVGRCVRLNRKGGEVTRNIEFGWCIRSFGSLKWFAPFLARIAQTAALSSTLHLSIKVYVTCLCDPDAVPTDIPGLSVVLERPSASAVLTGFTSSVLGEAVQTHSGRTSADSGDMENGDEAVITSVTQADGREKTISVDVPPAASSSKGKGASPGLSREAVGGGLGVCAAGPGSLTRDMSNAVAALSLRKGMLLGGVALHTEVYAI